jgi:hypothetical protein
MVYTPVGTKLVAGGRRSSPRRRARRAALISGRARERRRPDRIAGRINPGMLVSKRSLTSTWPRALMPQFELIQTDAVQVRDRPNAANTMSAVNLSPPASDTSTCEKPSKRAPSTSAPRGNCRPSL